MARLGAIIAPFSACRPPAPKGSSTSFGARASIHRLESAITLGDETVTAGSHLVRLSQPYGRLGKTLLERQVYPEPPLPGSALAHARRQRPEDGLGEQHRG